MINDATQLFQESVPLVCTLGVQVVHLEGTRTQANSAPVPGNNTPFFKTTNIALAMVAFAELRKVRKRVDGCRDGGLARFHGTGQFLKRRTLADTPLDLSQLIGSACK